MKISHRIRRYYWIFKTHLGQIIQRLKIEWDYQNRLSGLKKYIPKYKTRTPEEHEINRRKAVIPPSRCTHLKGWRIKGAYQDYNVTDHTFPDGSRRIRCNGCGTKWFPGQPGWDVAVLMMNTSTNTPTASEVPMGMNRRPDGTYVDNTPLEIARTQDKRY